MALPKDWLERYRRDLAHRLALQKIRVDGAGQLGELESEYARLRRLRELSSAQVIALLHRMNPGDLAAARDYHELVLAREAIVLPDDAMYIELWRQDVEADARRLVVTIRWVPEISNLNGYAWPTLKRAEATPIVSAATYLTVKHELAHNAHPCTDAHHRVKTEAGNSCCVRCEIAAWLWTLARAVPEWTIQMHRYMARSLRTYRRFATPAEQSEIDRLASDLGFHEVRLAAALTR